MSKFKVDYSGLETKIYKKAYRLSDVKDKIEKVAFDVVRFVDEDDYSKLWQVQSADDGDYIVALYTDDDKQTKTSSDWSVSISKNSKLVDVYYKGDPIVRLAVSALGIPPEEADLLPQYLPNKLATNKKLVTTLLGSTDNSVKEEILKKYPELA